MANTNNDGFDPAAIVRNTGVSREEARKKEEAFRKVNQTTCDEGMLGPTLSPGDMTISGYDKDLDK